MTDIPREERTSIIPIPCHWSMGNAIRDYLGHDYEEMTEQYIDYMPKKIEKASEDYFSRHSLASYIKRGEEKDG